MFRKRNFETPDSEVINKRGGVCLSYSSIVNQLNESIMKERKSKKVKNIAILASHYSL